MNKTVENEELQKSGLKKVKSKKNYYFDKEEEKAVIELINATEQFERDEIYRKKLHPAFTKIVECLIRQLGCFIPGEDYEDTFSEVLSNIILKMNKFDATKGTKAYSYYSNICKNYIIQKKNKFKRENEKKVSYDIIYPTTDKDNRIEDDKEKMKHLFNNELINNTISGIQTMLSVENIDKLTENEQKIGYALLEMLMNWEEIFNRLENNKFNKTSVWFFLKEYTDLDSKSIRDGLKKYKNLYFLTKQKMIEE